MLFFAVEMKPKMIDLILKYKVVEKVDWSILAYALDFDLATVMTISSKCDINMKEACTAVLSMWLGGKDGREPRTWGTLIEVLTDIDQRKLAEEIGYNLRKKSYFTIVTNYCELCTIVPYYNQRELT